MCNCPCLIEWILGNPWFRAYVSMFVMVLSPRLSKKIVGLQNPLPQKYVFFIYGNSFRSFFPAVPFSALPTSSGPLVPASMVIWTWSWSNPISLRTHRRFSQTFRKIYSQRFCTSGKLKMLWQYLVLKLRCKTFLPTLELWCLISAQPTLTRSIKISPGGAELLLNRINKSSGTTKNYRIKTSFIVVSVTTSHRSLRSL